MNFNTLNFQDFKQKNRLSTPEALKILTDKLDELKQQEVKK